MDIYRLSLTGLVLAVSLVAAPARSAEYDLKKNAVKTGQAFNMDFNVTMDEAAMTIGLGAQTIKGTMTMNTHRVQTMKITGTNGGQASELQTDVKEYTQKQAMTINGQPRNDNKNQPLHGVTIVSKLADGKWDNQLQTGEATEAQAKALRRMNPFESDALYEDRKMAVGESWSVPQEQMAKFFGESMAGQLTGTMQCKFERVEDLDGQSCAVITAHLKASGKAPEQPDVLITMELKGTMFRSLAEKVDLKVDLAGTIRMDGPLPNPPGAKMEVEGPMVMKYTSTLAK